MKKVIILVSMLVLMILTACGGTSVEDTAVAAPAEAVIPEENEVVASAAQLNEAYENALPIQMQLALGTLLLEDNNLGVDATQADELLPLWQAVQSMSASGTAADAEITAVVKQIQASMTPEQIVAIADMQLTQDAIRTLVADGLIVVEARGDQDAGGGAPGGGAPGSGGRGNALGGAQGDPAAQATREAARGSGGNNVLNQAVTTAVVQMLETKINQI